MDLIEICDQLQDILGQPTAEGAGGAGGARMGDLLEGFILTPLHVVAIDGFWL